MGESGVTLTPDFSAAATSYTASVANSVSSTTVTATKNHAAATVAITPTDANAGAAGHQVNLNAGFNTVTVKVTAEDDTTTRTYTVTVTRATTVAPAVSSDAGLSALSLSGVTLAPGFAAAATSYTASVADSVSSTTVTATPKHQATATVAITPNHEDMSAAGHHVNLDVGSNTVTVEVTAPDGATTRTYTVTVIRAAPGAAPPDITLQAKVLVTETVYEPQGGVIVAVRVRTDSYEKPQGSLTLTVRSFSDTAHEGTDYLPFTETVTFSPADFFGYYDSGFFEAIKYAARFRIVDDNTPESDERFIISVSTAASSASTAAAQGAIVTIDDGDEPLASTSSRQPRVASAIYDADEDAVVLEWDAGSDTGGLIGYRIERSAPGGATELTHADLRGGDRPAVGPGVSTWNDTTVPASSLVLYRVWAVFSDGSEVASAAFPATMDRGIARARATLEGSNIRYDVSWTDAAYPLGDGSLHYGVCPEGYKVYEDVLVGERVLWSDITDSDTDQDIHTFAFTDIHVSGNRGVEIPVRIRCGGDSATTGLPIGEDTATVQ